MTRLQPVHPGEVLRRDFMEPFGLSSTALARAIGVTAAPHQRDRCAAGAGFTAATALRLAKYFSTDAQSWMNLQTQYELALAEAAASGDLQTIRPIETAAP